MATLIDAIVSLRPGAEWQVKDGTITWLDQVQTQPTDQELQAEITRLSSVPVDTLRQWDNVSLQIAFNHENRIRALEGKATITVAQFKTAVKNLLT